MSAQIFVWNRQRKIALDRGRLQHFAERALVGCLALRAPRKSDLASLDEVDVLFVSDRAIAKLHRDFLGIRGATDVITFQHGEVFISTETAARYARASGSTLRDELELYVVHGLLHLHGFDDIAAAAARRMQATQNRLVAQLRSRPARPAGLK